MKVHNDRMAPADPALPDWKKRFAGSPLARKVVTGLAGRSLEIWHRTFNLLRSESSEYRNAVDDEFTAESRSHCGELLKTIVAIAAGRLGGSQPFDFVRRHAVWRARHQVPLVASLHAYRLAHKTYWALTREPLMAHGKRKEGMHSLTMLSDFWIEFFDYVGSVLEEAHMAEEARAAGQNTRVYAALVDTLLRGAEPDEPEARQLQTLCGIRSGMNMVVAFIRPEAGGLQSDIESAMRSVVRLVHQALPSSAFGKLVAPRNGQIAAIVSGEGATSERLVKILNRDLFGRRSEHRVFAKAGVSLDKSEVLRLPEAVAEARIALESASARRPLIHFAGIDITDFLILRADTAVLRLIPDWARKWHAAGSSRLDELFRTVRIFAECSLNVKETARRLGVHTNTVYFRLNQIRKRTNVDPRTFSGASFFLTTFRLLEQHSSGGSASCPRTEDD